MGREYENVSEQLNMQSFPHNVSTSNLVVILQKLAKNNSYYKPPVRAMILTEAARRLQAYRNEERRG